MKSVKNLAMIVGAKAAEESLAREEVKKLESAIPDGHPLKEEAAKQKAIMGGDLAGLPAGHPLLVGMEQARERYEKVKKAEESGEEVAIKKVHKIDDTKKLARIAERKKEDEQSDQRVDAAKKINGRLDETLVSVHGLWGVLSECEEILNTHPNSRARILRLKRLLFAVERGLSECKIARM